MANSNLSKGYFICGVFLACFFMGKSVYAAGNEKEEEPVSERLSDPHSVLLSRHLLRLQSGGYPPPPAHPSERFRRSIVTYIPPAGSLSPTVPSPLMSYRGEGEGRVSRSPSIKRVSFDESMNTTHDIPELENDSSNPPCHFAEQSHVDGEEFGPIVPELTQEAAIAESGSSPIINVPQILRDRLPSPQALTGDIPIMPGDLPGCVTPSNEARQPSPPLSPKIDAQPFHGHFSLSDFFSTARQDIRQERAMRDLERRYINERVCCCVIS